MRVSVIVPSFNSSRTIRDCLTGVLAQQGAEYEVIVAFNETVVQDDISEVIGVLFSYDADVDVAVQESFPPVARRSLHTDVPDFCRVVTAEIPDSRNHLGRGIRLVHLRSRRRLSGSCDLNQRCLR